MGSALVAREALGVFGPHRMRPTDTATRVARSVVCLSVCVCLLQGLCPNVLFYMQNVQLKRVGIFKHGFVANLLPSRLVKIF